MSHSHPSRQYRPLQIWIEPTRHTEVRRALKLLCLEYNTTLKALVLEAIDDLLRKYSINESTTNAD